MKLETGVTYFEGVKIKLDVSDDFIILCWDDLHKHLILKNVNKCFELQNRWKSWDGYFRVRFNKKRYTLHRFIYCLENSVDYASLKGFDICHSCDNPRCSNPNHLTKNTHSFNMWQKQHKYERANNIKVERPSLTPNEITYIISSGMDNKYLADVCGVDVSLIEETINSYKKAI